MAARFDGESRSYLPELTMLAAHVAAFIGVFAWQAAFPPPPVTDHSFEITFANLPHTVCRKLSQLAPPGAEVSASRGGPPCIDPGSQALVVRFP